MYTLRYETYERNFILQKFAKRGLTVGELPVAVVPLQVRSMHVLTPWEHHSVCYFGTVSTAHVQLAQSLPAFVNTEFCGEALRAGITWKKFWVKAAGFSLKVHSQITWVINSPLLRNQTFISVVTKPDTVANRTNSDIANVLPYKSKVKSGHLWRYISTTLSDTMK